MRELRGETFEELYRLIWDSLQSHLDGMYTDTPEGRAFHTRCVREYTRVLVLLAKLL